MIHLTAGQVLLLVVGLLALALERMPALAWQFDGRRWS